jgi:hypothetical protein
LNNKNKNKKPGRQRVRTQSSVLMSPAPTRALRPTTIARAHCVHPLPTYTRATRSYPFHSKLITYLRSGDVAGLEQLLHREDLPPRIMVRGRGGNVQLCQRSLSYTLTSDGLTGICNANEDPPGRGLVYATLRTACGACAVANDTRIHSTKGGTRYMRWRRVDRNPWGMVGVRGVEIVVHGPFSAQQYIDTSVVDACSPRRWEESQE